MVRSDGTSNSGAADREARSDAALDSAFISQLHFAVTRRCDNPACDERLRWTGKQGQPKRYCNALCKKRAAYALASLQRSAREVANLLANGGLSSRDARPHQARLAYLSWLIDAYPLSAVSRAERELVARVELEVEYTKSSWANYVQQILRLYRDGASIEDIAWTLKSDYDLEQMTGRPVSWSDA